VALESVVIVLLLIAIVIVGRPTSNLWLGENAILLRVSLDLLCRMLILLPYSLGLSSI